MSLRVGHGSSFADPIQSNLIQELMDPVHKYLVLNLTRELYATTYSTADF